MAKTLNFEDEGDAE
jgi:hypothetical protein